GDANRVVAVAVAVRVDRALEASDQLVAAAEDELPPGARRLPARHADRQDRRFGRDTVQPARAVAAGEDAGHLGAVPLDRGLVARIRAGGRVVAAVDHVEPREQSPAQVRLAAGAAP